MTKIIEGHGGVNDNLKGSQDSTCDECGGLFRQSKEGNDLVCRNYPKCPKAEKEIEIKKPKK